MSTVLYDNSSQIAGSTGTLVGSILAASFLNSGASVELSQLPIYLFVNNTDGVWPDAHVSIDLYSDNGNPLSPAPVAILQNIAVIDVTNSGGLAPPNKDAYPSGTLFQPTVFIFAPVTLQANTRYWVGLTPTGGADATNWGLAGNDSGSGVSTEWGDFQGTITANATAPPAALIMGPINGLAPPTLLEISLFGTKRYGKMREPACTEARHPNPVKLFETE